MKIDSWEKTTPNQRAKMSREDVLALLMNETQQKAIAEQDKMSDYSVYSIKTTTQGNIEISREVTNIPRQASLVEFNMDSKGLIKPNIKIYHEDPNTALKIAIVIMKEAKRAAAQLMRVEVSPT